MLSMICPQAPVNVEYMICPQAPVNVEYDLSPGAGEC